VSWFSDVTQIVEVWWHQIYRCWVGIGASAVLCKLVALVFRNERMKCMGQTLHFMRYIHKENFAVWTASVTGKGISYASSMEPQVAVLRYLRLAASFSCLSVTKQPTVWLMYRTDQFTAWQPGITYSLKLSITGCQLSFYFRQEERFSGRIAYGTCSVSKSCRLTHFYRISFCLRPYILI